MQTIFLKKINKQPLVFLIIGVVIILAIFFSFSSLTYAQGGNPTAPSPIINPTANQSSSNNTWQSWVPYLAKIYSNFNLGGVAARQIDTATKGTCIQFWTQECILDAVSWLSNGVLVIVGYILIYAAIIFDKVREIVLNPATYANVDVIKFAWTKVRDVANIFFIFILLLIAIATILRRESYGAKALLVRLVLVAIFINFSFTATLYIILPLNSLADFFVTTTLDNNEFVQYKDSRDTVNAFIQGLKPGVLYENLGNPDNNFFEASINTYGTPAQEKLKTRKAIETPVQTTLYIIAGTVLGIILIFFTAFILLVAAFLFLIRIAILWILMIFSPLAFLFMILPRTRSIANQWWSTLIDQAIFPAAFLFMFFIVVSIGASGISADIFHINQSDPGKTFVEFTAFYIILLIMLYASLLIARKFGAYGSSTAMSWAGGLKKYATGALMGAGGIAAYYTAGAGARYAETKVGEEKMADLKSSVLARPFARGLEKVARIGGREAAEKERIEGLKYSAPRDLMNKFNTLSLAEQNQVLQNKELAKRLETAYVDESIDKQQKTGLENAIERQNFNTQSSLYRESPKIFAKAFGERNKLRKETQEEVLRNADKQTLQEIAKGVSTPKEQKRLVEETARTDEKQAQLLLSVLPQYFKEASRDPEKADLAKTIRNIDFENIKKEELDAIEKVTEYKKDTEGKIIYKDGKAEEQPVNNALVLHMSTSQRQKILNAGGDASDVYLKQFINIKNDIKQTTGNDATPEDIAQALEKAGNLADANKFRSNDRVFLGFHDPEWAKRITEKEKKETIANALSTKHSPPSPTDPFEGKFKE